MIQGSVDSSAADVAARWYARRQSAALTPAEQADFEAWLARDKDNRRAWERLEATLMLLDRHGEDEAIRVLRAEALAQPARATPIWKPLAAAAAVVAMIGVGSLAGWRYLGQPGGGATVAAKEYGTGVGQRARIQLTDGSTIILNTDTRVNVPAWTAERRIELVRGEAFFRVAKDAAHPFIVASGRHSVTALGTSFGVAVLPGRYSVALVEGKVKVEGSANGRPATLSPGQRLVEAADNVTITEGADAATGWIESQLRFDATPLADVVAEMNRYSEHKLVLGDPALRSKRFSGTLRPDGAQALIDALSAYHIARVGKRTDQETVLVGF
jgi:transmembrane sensor